MESFRRFCARLWRYCRALLFSRKTLFPPPQAEVLIYYGAHEHLSRLLHPLKPAVLRMEGEELNIPVLFKALFKKGGIAEAYEDCYINCVRPRVIMTFIDNSSRFYLLSERHPHVRTMFVQNGWRGGVSDVFHTCLNHRSAQGEFRRVDIMCTFGDAIGREYRKHIRGETIAIGSLRNNEFPVAGVNKKVRRIAYISIYSEANNYATKAVEIVLPELMRYSLSRGIPLAVVGRKNLDSEENYYRRLLGENFEFHRRDGTFGSYRYLDESEVSVSIDSTLGYETVARGNKNAFFSILGCFHATREFNFGWPATYPDEGPFWTNAPAPAAFERILDHLFAINNEQWRAELAAYGYADLVTYDPGNTTLKAILKKELGESYLASSQSCSSQEHTRAAH